MTRQFASVAALLGFGAGTALTLSVAGLLWGSSAYADEALSPGECYPMKNTKVYWKEFGYSVLGQGWEPYSSNKPTAALVLRENKAMERVVVTRQLGGWPDGTECIVAVIDQYGSGLGGES